MAIYSLRLSSVGKTTQKQPFTAAAHLKYITRKAAVSHVMSARMPGVRRQAIAWLRHQERDDRKNARVIDKVVLALPRELPTAARHAVVAAFAEALTKGRASWFAAFHMHGKDRENPHCHLVLRDRDPETGKRVMFLSAGKKEAAQRRETGKAAPTTVKDIRALWERCANAALQGAGRAERIDRRTLAEQGVRRNPQVHEGPNIRAMHARGFKPKSRDRVARVRGGRRGTAPRIIRWAEIDRGQTRVEYNAALRAEARASVVVAERVAAAGSGRLGPALHVVPSGRTARELGVDESSYLQMARTNEAGPVVVQQSPAIPVPTTLPERVDGGELSLTELFAQETGAGIATPRTDDDRSRGR